MGHFIEESLPRREFPEVPSHYTNPGRLSTLRESKPIIKLSQTDTQPEPGWLTRFFGSGPAYAQLRLWIFTAPFALAVFGCAFDVFKRAGSEILKTAAISNVALGIAIILLTLGLDLKLPRSKSADDPLPSLTSYLFISLKSLVSLAGPTAIFVAVFRYGNQNGDNNKAPGAFYYDPRPVRHVAIACACFGAIVVLMTLVPWLPVLVAGLRGYSVEEKRKMYRGLLQKKTEGDVEDASY